MGEGQRGRLTIYMGYAAGVGKTYKMLANAQALRAGGTDVVIAYFEPHGRRETIAQTEGLEVIPRRRVQYRGAWFEEMDTPAVVARHPAVAVVDEFAHSNVPGLEHEKRWEDVETLLEAGISVLTTMNIQHLESLNDQVQNLSGVLVRETVPDWVVQRADEVVMVDLTPRALLHRLQRGVVYDRDKAEQALANFFRESTLVALRELALRQTAHEVEQRLAGEEAPAAAQPARSDQRILIFVTANPKTAMLVRRGKRVSDFLGAECFAVAVQPGGDLSRLPQPQREAVEQHLNFARNLHIETRVLAGEDAAETLVEFARRNQVTQIYITRPARRGWPGLQNHDPGQRILDLAGDMQVVVVSDRKP